MKDKCDVFVSTYLEWLKTNIKVASIGDYCEITTPFLDRHNDHIQIYAKATDTGFRLTDDSYIISDLEMSGCNMETEGRKKAMREILNGFGVNENDGELFVETTKATLAHKTHSLIQAMISVNDLFLISTHRVANFFLEDVQKFLDKHDIRNSPRVSFTGKSGYPHTFDFVIPKSRNSPERLIRAINSPSKEKAELAMFAWTDTKDVRPKGSLLLAILNDTDGDVNSDVITALKHYDISPIRWSEMDRHVPVLAA